MPKSTTRGGSRKRSLKDSGESCRLTPKQLRLLRFIRGYGHSIFEGSNGRFATWPKNSPTFQVVTQNQVEQLAYNCLDVLSEYFGGVLGITRISYSQMTKDAPPLGPLKRPGPKPPNAPVSPASGSTT